MTIRAVTAAALVLFGVTSGSAHAAGRLGINGGLAFPLGVAGDELSRGYNVGLTYDWTSGPVMFDVETGFASWDGTHEYVDIFGPHSVDYRLRGHPFLFHMKAPLTHGSVVTPYVLAGLGLWRLTDDLLGFSVDAQSGIDVGAGLSQTVNQRVGVDVECLYRAVRDFDWRQWINLRAQLTSGTRAVR